MRFTPPQTIQIVMSRTLFIKGKTCPKGMQFGHLGDVVNVHTENGADWYINMYPKGRKTPVKVAVIPSTL